VRDSNDKKQRKKTSSSSKRRKRAKDDPESQEQDYDKLDCQDGDEDELPASERPSKRPRKEAFSPNSLKTQI
jgi:hypothetical protein